MTFDPEQNRIQTCLLTEDERDVLKAAKHGWQRYRGGMWYEAETPSWDSTGIYRAKPAPALTITVNGIEVPEPVREGLGTNEEYWVADPTFTPLYKRHWDNLPAEFRWLNSGLIHRTEAAADAHASAMLASSKKGGA